MSSRAPELETGFSGSLEQGWTLAVLPDTQDILWKRPEVLTEQLRWIAAQRDRYRILFALHEGDVTEHNSPEQWQAARGAFSLLDQAGIPYAAAVGNHDLDEGTRHSLINRYFRPWQDCPPGAAGYYDPASVENSWRELQTPTGTFLILTLEFAPRDEVLVWADRVLAERPDRRVILLTHAYLYHDGTRYDWERYGAAQEYSPKTYFPKGASANDGEEMWRKLVSRHANILLVLSGHVLGRGAAYLVSEGRAGNRVHQVMANFQRGVIPDREDGCSGFLRLMHFRNDPFRVEVRTYSPVLDQWLDDPEHGFTLADFRQGTGCKSLASAEL